MKFAHKLALSILFLLAAVLSCGGFWMIYQDFNSNLKQAEAQNIHAHLRDKYALETELVRFDDSAEESKSYYIYTYCKELNEFVGNELNSFAVFTVPSIESAGAIFSNLPLEIGKTVQLKIINAGEKTLQLYKTDKNSYMLMATRVNGTENLWYLSCFNITKLFNARNEQLNRFIQLEAVALLVSAAAAFLISGILTRNIKSLEAVSKSIAGGAYNMRSNIRSKDEIGALGTSFNTMAQAVSDKVSELNLSIKQRDDFVAAFTHEIKTPMTAILGYADLLRGGRYTEAEMQMAAGYIYHESKRLEALSQKLLALMQLSGSSITLVRASVQDIISACIKSISPKSSTFLSVEASAYKGYVLADADLITDLLRNLVLNAIKACGESPQIKIDAKLQNKDVVFSISDNGCGISAEDLPHVTQPFYMADKSRAREQNGSGMGLALAQQIAKAHNTTLKIESEQGIGTVVSFCLCTVQEVLNEADN